MSPWICSSPHTRSLPCHLRIFSPFCGQMHPRCSFLFRLCSKLLQSDRQKFQLPRRNLQRKPKQTVHVNTLSVTLVVCETILCLIICHTSWEGAVIERRSLVLRPVKVLTGWHTQHQCKHMVRPQGAPLQHRDLRQAAHCLRLLKESKNPVWISQLSWRTC